MNVTALAVIVDSAVTLGVGYWLNRTAKKEVKGAVSDIEPAIRNAVGNIAEEFKTETKQEIARSIQKLIPLILKGIKNASRSTPVRTEQSSTITEPSGTGEQQSPDTN